MKHTKFESITAPILERTRDEDNSTDSSQISEDGLRPDWLDHSTDTILDKLVEAATHAASQRRKEVTFRTGSETITPSPERTGALLKYKERADSAWQTYLKRYHHFDDYCIDAELKSKEECDATAEEAFNLAYSEQYTLSDGEKCFLKDCRKKTVIRNEDYISDSDSDTSASPLFFSSKKRKLDASSSLPEKNLSNSEKSTSSCEISL